MLRRLFGQPGLLIGVSKVLQALGTPLIAFLVANSDMMSGGIEDPISFCNVLFVGNSCAGVVILSLYGWRPIREDLVGLDWRSRLELFVFGALSALLSALIYTALETVSVTNAVLLARLGPLLYAILTAALFGQALRGSEWAGFGFIILGLGATVLGTSGTMLTMGDMFILLSTLVYAVVTLLSKRLLGKCKLPTVVFARNAISAVVFFIIANALFGPHHFADAFAGRLWVIMLVYSVVVIVVAQLLWYSAVRQVEASTVAKWTVLTPIIAIIYAFFLNGERPSFAQLAALSLVTVGVLIANLGRLVPKPVSDAPESAISAS